MAAQPDVLSMFNVHLYRGTYTHTHTKFQVIFSQFVRQNVSPLSFAAAFSQNINETQPFSPQRYFAPLIVVTRT